MLNQDDFIIHKGLRKNPRYVGEVNSEKRFACFYDNCGDFRGYIKISHYNKRCKSKNCGKCVKKSDVFRNKVSNGLKIYNKNNPYQKDEKQVIRAKLRNNLRNRLNQALKGNYKSGSAVKDLGCSIDEFKAYLESRFKAGMTWDNYGRKGWHIDHIRPLSNFDLSIEKELKQACNFKNLQSLWAKENLEKSDKVILALNIV